ncbi:hypothetical protein RRG08_018798 [Elysia crispata]|uniref:Uncharacterized protein n=1 Tax=Elysia crispata TaxID=231223 RepID=A0AAE0ZTT5_9GAST|nr:hypothetical protein RRG08_018798 [Elysia crispata]
MEPSRQVLYFTVTRSSNRRITSEGNTSQNERISSQVVLRGSSAARKGTVPDNQGRLAGLQVRRTAGKVDPVQRCISRPNEISSDVALCASWRALHPLSHVHLATTILCGLECRALDACSLPVRRSASEVSHAPLSVEKAQVSGAQLWRLVYMEQSATSVENPGDKADQGRQGAHNSSGLAVRSLRVAVGTTARGLNPKHNINIHQRKQGGKMTL